MIKLIAFPPCPILRIKSNGIVFEAHTLREICLRRVGNKKRWERLLTFWIVGMLTNGRYAIQRLENSHIAEGCTRLKNAKFLFPFWDYFFQTEFLGSIRSFNKVQVQVLVHSTKIDMPYLHWYLVQVLDHFYLVCSKSLGIMQYNNGGNAVSFWESKELLRRRGVWPADRS